MMVLKATNRVCNRHMAGHSCLGVTDDECLLTAEEALLPYSAWCLVCCGCAWSCPTCEPLVEENLENRKDS